MTSSWTSRLKGQEVKWSFIILAYILLLFQSVLDNSRGPIYPELLADFQIDAARGSWIFALASLSGLIANLTTRWWLPKIEAIHGTHIALVLLTISSYLFGISLNHGTYLLDISSVLMGFGMGIGNVTMNILIVRGTKEQFRRQFFSGLHSVYGVGSLSAPLILNIFLANQGTWSLFFQYLSIIPFLILVCSITNISRYQHVSLDKKVVKEKLSAPAKLNERLLYGFVFGFYVASEIVVSTRLVLYLTTEHGISVEHSRTALSLFFLLLLCGRFLFTILPIKGSSQRWLIASCCISLILYIASFVTTPFILPILGLSMSIYYPVAMDWLSKKFPTGFDWMTASVQTSVSLILVLMHIGFGHLSDLLGIEYAMGLVPLFQFICLLLLLKLGRAN
tara:strand:- start:1936 stop:3114 length:1179 start_codon:yes stop_codon:yes gene_type:complete